MSSLSLGHEAAPPRRWRYVWVDLFGSPLNTTVTVLVVAAGTWTVLWPLARWSLIDATWSGDAALCTARAGACWAFIGEKLRFILFGFYPQPLQWRAALAIVILVALILVTAWPPFWSRTLLLAWIAGIVVVPLVLLGVPFGPFVPTDQWGGLPVSLLLSVGALAGAFPLAIGLALARRSKLGGLRLLAIIFVEVVRGVPFIAVLYGATLLFPLMLPAGAGIDKFLRAEVALTLFVSAYLAEIVRAGLQAVEGGQYEAGAALGLSYGQTMRLVVLPQALRIVIPALVNLAMGIFQDTTLVIIIGMFDFLNTARVSASDPNWLGFYNEAYAFAALIYFTICFAASRYSLWLERRLSRLRT